jgi:hypothetical protein
VSRPLEGRDGPDLHVEFDQLLSGVDLAFTASNGPTWAEFIVRGRIPVAEGVEVFHYAEPEQHRVALPTRARSAAGGSV